MLVLPTWTVRFFARRIISFLNCFIDKQGYTGNDMYKNSNRDMKLRFQKMSDVLQHQQNSNFGIHYSVNRLATVKMWLGQSQFH
jgi:hypothetical protein